MVRCSFMMSRKSVYVGKFKDLDEAERAVVAARNRLHTHNDLDRVAGQSR